MDLIVSTAALKGLAKMPKHDQRAMREKLETFAHDPYEPHAWAKRLVGTKAVRVRHGDWRAVCDVDGKALVVTVEKVGNRKEVYQ
jgi:mRNA interferase RelE/StbE